MIMVEKENAKNEQYVFKYLNENISEVITYKKHVIINIKNHPAANDNADIQNFPSESVTDDKFDRFISVAGNARFKI